MKEGASHGALPISLFLIFSLIVLFAVLYIGIYLKHEVKKLEEFEKELKNDLNLLKKDINETKMEISSVYEFENSLKELNATLRAVRDELYLIKERQEDIIKLLSLDEGYKYTAVNFVGLTQEGGVILPIKIGIKRGSGNIYLRLNGVTYDESFQDTVKRAIIASMRYLKEDYRNFDVILWVENPFVSPITIEGGSMGAAISLGILSLVENKKIREDTIITGGISSNGTILKVKRVKEKVNVAKEYGIKRFLVPKGQNVNVSDIEVIEVEDLEEAAREFLE